MTKEFLKNTGPKYMSMFMCMLPAEWILCSVNRWLTSSAQKKWTRWQGCFLAYPIVCLSSKYGNEAFGHNPTLPTCSSYNPLLVHRLHLGYDVTGLQQEDGKSTITYININWLIQHFHSVKLTVKSHETDYICSEQAHTLSVSSSSLSAEKSNLATPCTADCMPGTGWPGNRKQVEKLIVW